jgi:hypothetical protein
MRAWFVGGTAIFLVGWIAVGVPIVALGERVSAIKYFPIIALVSGLGGALILFLPDLVIRMTDRRHQYPWSLADLGWPGIGFACAAATALMYCILLHNFHTSGVRSGDEALR